MALTLFRLALAPVIVALGLTRGSGTAVAILLVAGFLSDVFDGVVARRSGTETAALRRLDSSVDTVFFLAIAVAAWRLHRGELAPLVPVIGLVIATEIGTNALSWLRFRREASYHAWSARIFGLLLFIALLALFARGSSLLLLPALIVGLASHAENAAITLLLPAWQHDVHSLRAAWRIRRASARVRG